MSKAEFPEKVLARAWRCLRVDPSPSPPAPGLQVIFPGKPNDGAGPDFLGAMVATGGGQVVTGDAEVDLRPELWRHHGHHRNPLYRDVSFQVVLEGSRAPLAPGCPTVIAVRPDLPPGNGAVPPAPCPAVTACRPEALARLIAWAGEVRFRAKAEAFTRAITRGSPGQALYRGLMESLGYSHNQAPFHRLAVLLPLRRLERLSVRAMSFQALLLGSAGLLPGQAARGAGLALPGGISDPEVARMEKEWREWRLPALMGRNQWRFFKVRPANSPPRRLAAAAYLLRANWLPDPANRMIALLETPAALEKSLGVPSYGYWKTHMDFGIPAPGAAWLLGGDRRADMIINIVLPFSYAWGSLQGWRRLRSLALELYSAWAGGGDNLRLRFMRSRLPGMQLDSKARQQQGLLHIFHSYCRNGQCRLCPLLRGARLGGVASRQ